MDNNTLMLVIATNKELDFYRKKHGLTSSFFNLGHILRLQEFNDEEIKYLLCLPASTMSGYSPALGIRDQELVRELGGNHPFLLQIAGSLVCEARQHQHNESWVRKKFDKEYNRLPSSSIVAQKLKHPLCSIKNTFSAIGAFGLWLAEFWGNSKNVVLGVVAVTLITYCLRNPSKVQGFLEHLLNLTK